MADAIGVVERWKRGVQSARAGSGLPPLEAAALDGDRIARVRDEMLFQIELAKARKKMRRGGSLVNLVGRIYAGNIYMLEHAESAVRELLRKFPELRDLFWEALPQGVTCAEDRLADVGTGRKKRAGRRTRRR